jgi:hypothetical protein
VRRFAQPLGIDLTRWEDRIIKTEKGIVRLLPVSERAQQLFGKEGARAVAERLEFEQEFKDIANDLFPETLAQAIYEVKGRKPRKKSSGVSGAIPSQADLTGMEKTVTTLDRVHAAMLLQAGGQTNALRNLIKTEQNRGQEFLRLANALSALYPKGSEEKRLLDAMLLAVPR